ncbi:ESX-1 secretion-associated protein [Mycolicibacterium smegmatis]|uniref:ESX-1 secretion-associated protein n=2 Tax=Mycolicibacterium smegmatis TaxID=1772 RepID=A0QNK5_MYCS2|nr:ESX-1 secretion-associated protein [Mycolicibacterium smegmatis]ABK72283.1 hypothetical protein MSMEG_0077 [Mycolicibacterium smegmatis MC2 155]AIU05358.1 hypothetical protein LJ00_00390 [Mycolicibacterium smegmatis MC2 155]AIU11983.1 hypothetical protein LI99_00390 [Mycolicibacterium smegmatis]AIU18607.1 hypothetical protein LI98_00390 [Mycolicibacterium smegmatis]MBE9621999.1 ESX-1 secretion-associated protein [Mycolicibacterium smegmatis]
MSGDLKVTAAELRELSERQRQIVENIATAAQATNNTTALVTVTHGPVCAPTIAAIGAAGFSRDAAAAAMQGVSTSLAEKLDEAATNYERTDAAKAGDLDGEMHGS